MVSVIQLGFDTVHLTSMKKGKSEAEFKKFQDIF